MQTKRQNPFTTVRTEGAILPADLLQRVAGGRDLDGLTPESYHLAGERLNDAINDAWNKLTTKWRAFREALGKLTEADPATSVTRERWLLPLFQELGYGRLIAAKPFTVEDKTYPVSHAWQKTPIHLVGFRVELDRRGGQASSPHGLVQEFLNRSDDHLWALLSNGGRLRILRDNASFTRQAYVEFDLEAMMDGEVYADFSLLWLLCHESRVPVETPADCWLERWMKVTQERGTRALDQLRDGVETAITALGRGFVAHPANAAIREALRTERLTRQDYYRQLLRVVYRLLFLFVAEDRGVLLDPGVTEAARRRYTDHYSTVRLRRLAERRRGTRHADLYVGLNLVMEKLGADAGCPELALPALGSFLWSSEAVRDLAGCRIANHDLLDAVRALAFTVEGRVRRPVDYRNLGSEELGSVYESLLELHPALSVDAGTFALETAGGHERKTTGSYYTASGPVSRLLNSALDPVLDEAVRRPDPVAALLDVKVCDTACGSGHFLIGAAHRIAKRLASVRSGEEEPPPEAVRAALRDVIGRCVFGVDQNAMAVELCKVALWMEAMEPGKPLSFLDAHIRCGNSLLGATPALLRRGIPDEAFELIEGDDKAFCRTYRKRNKDERGGQATMFDAFEGKPWERLGNLAAALRNMESLPDATIEQVHEKERLWAESVRTGPYQANRLLADAWCASFVWIKAKDNAGAYFLEPVTQATFEAIAENPNKVPESTRKEVERLARQYQFFHWHLAFPDVFQPLDRVDGDDVLGWRGGFHVVLGNPPWERIKLQEQEWFAERRPEIAKAPNAAARRKMIARLVDDDPALSRAFLVDRRRSEGESHFIRNAGRYPLCGRGDVNTYTIFAETNRQLIRPEGRVGCIVPPGIATDDTTKFFFQDLIRSRSLASLHSFENEEFLFPGVDHRFRFCLLSLTGPDRPVPAADFVFFARRVEHLDEADRHFTLTADDIALMNPNTGTCSIFRSKRDAEINKAIYRRIPVLIREGTPEVNPWRITFLRQLDMANDSGLFRTQEELEADDWALDGNTFRRGNETYLPLFEAKMVHYFDHRFGTYKGQTDAQSNQGKLPELDDAQHADPGHTSLPWYWVPKSEVEQRLQDRWDRGWLMGWRDVCRNTDTRTVIASLLPRVGVGHKFPLALPVEGTARHHALLYSNLCSFVLDYTARQKLGGTSLSYFHLKQFPIVAPVSYDVTADWSTGQTVIDWLLPRVLELTYTAWDLAPFARDCGYDGPPYRWDDARRFLLRCELDAAFFHLYGLDRDDTAYVLDTFPVVRKRDEARHGEYRTARVILEVYYRMADAARTGVPYATLLDPPPADPRVAHQVRNGSPALAPHAVKEDHVYPYIALLLDAWKRPVRRDVLDAALVLMLNDEVRQAILGRRLTGRERTALGRPPVVILGLDGFLDRMRGAGYITIETVQGRQVLRLGPDAPSRDDAPAEYTRRVKEVLRAIEVLGDEQALLDHEGIGLETYTIVS